MPRRTFALATAVFVALTRAAAAQQGPSSRVLVVPFENVRSEPRVSWLSEASAVLVSDGLRDRGVAAITRSERVRAFEQLHLPVSATLTRATVIKVAQLVGAAEVIVGSFRVEGTDLTVQARSIRVDAGRLQPVVTERGPLAEMFAIYDRVSRRIAQDAAVRDGTPARPPLGAFESYIKGLVAQSPATQATFLESALREYPAFDRARLALWEVRTDQGDHAAALAAARGVDTASPLSTRARFFVGVSLLNLQRYDESYTTFKALLDNPAPGGRRGAGPDPGAIYNNLGVVQIRRGAGASQSGAATYFLTKATDADPSDTDYRFNLGYAYALERDQQAAIYWLREALRRDPADADAHLVLAVSLQATGSTVEAGRERELARQLSSRYEELERRPGPEVPRGLERVQMDPAGSSAAWPDRAIVAPAQRDQREVAAFHLERGRRLYEREQDSEALVELRRAVYLSPYEAQAHLLIGRIHLRAGRPAEAVDALKISIWSEETAPARVALAEAYLKSGDSAAARREAERALALDPSSPDAKRVLAGIK